MQANGNLQNENIEVGIQNMNIGQHPHVPGQGANQLENGDDVRINIDDQNLGINAQRNQQEIHDQAPVGVPPNQGLPGGNNNLIVRGAVDAGNNEPFHPGDRRGQVAFPLGRIQGNLPQGNAMQPHVPVAARNEPDLGLNQNNQGQQQFLPPVQQDNAINVNRYQGQLVFNQHQIVNQQNDVPIDLANHNRALVNVHQNQAFHNNGQDRIYQFNNPNNIQAAGNVQVQGFGQPMQRIQNRPFVANQGMQGFQEGDRIGINANVHQPLHHPNNNHQSLALPNPNGFQVERNVNRQAAGNTYASHRPNNRYAPYMDMRRMSQNAKKMAMMVWSMAEAAMYVPNNRPVNDNARNNPNERDDDDRSQFVP